MIYDDPIEPWSYRDALRDCERCLGAEDWEGCEEAIAKMYRLEALDGKTWHVPEDFRERREKLMQAIKFAQCNHKFVDSKNCLKCGWVPE